MTGSTVSLNWSAPVGGDGPTSYIVQAGSAPGLSDLASFDTGSTATTLVVLGVPAGSYYVRIRANNSAGFSDPSNEFLLVVAGASPCGSLSAPGGLSASVTGSTVSLTWVAPPGCAPTSYIIQAGSTPGASNLANFSTGSTATTFTATGVGAGTYYVRILSAAGGVVSAPSTEIAFAIGGCATAPSAPTNLVGTVSGSTLTLSWSASPGICPATSYVLQAGSSPGATNLGTATVAGTSLTAVGLGNGTYYIRVYGLNAAGSSPASAEIVVNIGTAAPPPVGIVASFQFFDPAQQVSATDTCVIKSNLTNSPSTCEARSTSFTTGANTIASYEWTVQYTYATQKTFTGTNPTMSVSETCGGIGSSEDGAIQPLSVTLTVTDNLGAKATATSGVGSQPPLKLRLYKC